MRKSILLYWPDAEFFTRHGHIPADFIVDGYSDAPRVRAVHRPTGIWVKFRAEKYVTKITSERAFITLFAHLKLHDAFKEYGQIKWHESSMTLEQST